MMIVVMVAITFFIIMAIQVLRIAAKIMKVMRRPKLWSSIRKEVEPEADYYSNRHDQPCDRSKIDLIAADV